MIVSITKLERKSLWVLPRFFKHVFRINKQLKSSKCVEFGTSGKGKCSYTKSLWQNENDMMAFVTSGAHLSAMKDIKRVARSTKVKHYEADKLPDWEFVFKELA